MGLTVQNKKTPRFGWTQIGSAKENTKRQKENFSVMTVF